MKITKDGISQPLVMVFSSETYRAPLFLEAAKRLGVELVLVSDAGDATAKLLGARYIDVDLSDPEAGAERVARAMEGRRPGGVVALDDAAVRLAAIASSRLGTSANSPAGVMATRDKAALRRRLAVAGVPQPRFLVVSAPDDRVLRDVGEVCGFPCVVKPAELSASTGVIRADDENTLLEAVKEAFEIQFRFLRRRAALVVEEFLPGREIAVEAIATEGEIEILSYIDKPEAPAGPYFPETILVTPADLDEGERAKAAQIVEEAARSLGIVDGPIHAELRQDGGEYRLLEIAARTIGGLCSMALRYESQTLEEIVLRRMLGDMREVRCSEGISGVVMLYPERSGLVRRIDGVEEALSIPEVTGVELTVREGASVDPLPYGNRYLGFVFARSDNRKGCISALRRARDAIRAEIETKESVP